MESPTMPTVCDRCGKPFNTDEQHPRRYCSIACEEGRSPLPKSDPRSPNYYLYLKGEPQSLIGKDLIAAGLKRTCYSPDWHKKPHRYNSRRRVDHDSDNEVLVLTDDVHLGKVINIHEGQAAIESWEGEEQSVRYVDMSVVVSQLRQERWWADG